MQPFVTFSAADHAVWRALYAGTQHCRQHQAVDLFNRGLATLEIGPDDIPDLVEVNKILATQTGWQGVYAQGLLDARTFFSGLSQRKFPVGAFIRSADDLAYTPAPDVFHDLYGHLPLLADQDYADFCAAFGALAWSFRDDPKKLQACETFFWFGVEFPIIKTQVGLRIFGGGILSSKFESDYCLSGKPELRPFDPILMAKTPYRIDQVQDILYVLDRPEQLYNSITIFSEGLARDT